MNILHNDQIRVTSISITLQFDCFFYSEVGNVRAEVAEWAKHVPAKSDSLNSIMEYT